MPLDNQSGEQNKHKVREKVRQPIRLANRFQWGVRQRYSKRDMLSLPRHVQQRIPKRGGSSARETGQGMLIHQVVVLIIRQ